MAIFFGLELAMKSYAFGIRRAYSQMNWVLKLEFFYQPLIWILWFIFVAGVGNGEYYTEVNIFSLGILLRSLRMSSLLNEIQLWRNFVRTLRALVKPFFNFSLTLYSLYLIYASIGLEFFGGKINEEFMSNLTDEQADIIDSSWLYLNFNDYVMSLNTLFGLMWQNDWEAMVYMFELVYDL